MSSAAASGFTGISVFFFILFFASLKYGNGNRASLGKYSTDDWLFKDIWKKLYGAVFRNSAPEESAVKMGIDLEKYRSDCSLAGIEPDLEKSAMIRVLAFLILMVSLVISFFVSFLLLAAGLMCFVFLFYYDSWNMSRKAQEKRDQIEADLPRFLDLLDTVTSTGMAVQTAIYLVSEKSDSLLSRELNRALNEMQMGANGWSMALEQVAARYRVDLLDDFVREVTTSYQKGIRIDMVIHRQASDIRRAHLLAVKENASRAEQKILVPIAICKILPMMGYLMFPAVTMITEGLA